MPTKAPSDLQKRSIKHYRSLGVAFPQLADSKRIQANSNRFLPDMVRLETCRSGFLGKLKGLLLQPGQVSWLLFFESLVILTPVRYNGGQLYIIQRTVCYESN